MSHSFSLWHSNIQHCKFITKILQTYCGKTSFFVEDSTDFIQKIKHLSIVSFDVNTLFTNIPVPVALQVINSKISPYTNFTSVCKIPTKNSSSFWNSLSPTVSSASIRNPINNCGVQPWVNLSPLSLQISIWNILNPWPFLHLQHKSNGGSGMLPCAWCHQERSSQQTWKAPQLHRSTYQIHHRTLQNRWVPLPRYPDQTHS